MPAVFGYGYGYRYRRWVLDSLRYVDVQDLATGGDHIPELGDVYVDVALVSRAKRQAAGGDTGGDTPGTAGDTVGDTAGDTGRDTGGEIEEVSGRRSVSELLDRRSRVVLALIGQPGSGKSTLLAHVARRSAQPLLRRRPGRRHVPILIALREQAASIAADPAISLPAVVRAAVAQAGGGGVPGREPRGWWERQLGRGRCLVLLDGLDEVARAGDRLAVAGWVERQIAAYPGSHFVVTARSFAVPAPLAALADVLVVRPFTAEQVQLFLDRWYLAAEQHATGASGAAARRAVRMRARESATRLTMLLREHPALYALAANPLLLTMIATAHRYRGALPGDRADLYGEICQVLLSRRAQAKGLPELLPWPAKQALLAALAYRMMRDHVCSLAAADVVDVLGPQLERFPASVTGEAFLDDISHNGLLTEVTPGQYAFTHLTFQEYLAARHVSASPELVKSLTVNVNDPWWHETSLLYASAADASPIVRACLDSGTIRALTLAFDCDEASSEIDPGLRKRLDRERERAYEPGCSGGHRRLIAGVQATRLVRRTLITEAGTKVCAQPVPADLYWLFLQDTGAPQPDNPCVPSTSQPATGVWGTEAKAFVAWLNSVTATATGLEVRLPRQDELQEEAVAGTLARQLPPSVTSAWAAPQPGPQLRPGLWVRPGKPHPHELSGTAIRQAVAADAANTTLLPQVLTAAVLDVALKITRDLDDIQALSGALDADLTARANSGGKVVGILHAHAHAIVLSYAHALGLARADAVTRTCAADPELISALGLAPALALADAIAGDLADAVGLGHARAVELAEAIDLDMKILSAFDFDLAHVLELARDHAASLDRALALARDIPRDAALPGVFGLPGVQLLDPALALPGLLGLPLRWAADGPLASTLLGVLAASPAADEGARPLPGGLHLAFAHALCSRAGIGEETRLLADLGSPLTEPLRDLAAAKTPAAGGSTGWHQATGLSRLTDACAPVSAAHRPPGPAAAAALRAVALAMAGDMARDKGDDAAGFLRGVATVTLIENRGKGEASAGESVILALA